ncbi:hypothetical protein C8N35_11343 [Breoghania corrubedonensis]|uniref:Uncharacterized protein n=1 Tax=Breoghania corrubedonensis TaxID=665038 RepID=A0A2T5UU34_9HYPH|nr:hypothetical protein [Breoghania corrubedonensis]PTW55002.1 hypothetical protein C8N35_11343 [Breoghania corrubedonensis]
MTGDLVPHIDRKRKATVYSNFEDKLGAAGEVDFVKFKRKARHFLLEHEDNIGLQKLRRGKPLAATSTDVAPSGHEQVFDLKRTNKLTAAFDGINRGAVV